MQTDTGPQEWRGTARFVRPPAIRSGRRDWLADDAVLIGPVSPLFFPVLPCLSLFFSGNGRFSCFLGHLPSRFCRISIVFSVGFEHLSFEMKTAIIFPHIRDSLFQFRGTLPR